MKKLLRLKVLPIVLSALFLFPTVFGLGIYNSSAQSAYIRRFGPLNEQAKEYVDQYNQTCEDLTLAEIQYELNSKYGKSMTMLIFQTCSIILYENVYGQAMSKYKASGIFTVRDDECVGQSGCITKAQCEEMLRADWKMALALPETVPKDFDFDAYIAHMKELLDDQKLSFPKIFVFGRTNYTRELYKSVVAYGFETVAYNAQDENCRLSPKPLTESDGLMLVPYMYTSKRTPIRSNYEKALKRGECLSISTGGAQTGMSGETATRDTTVGSLKDIVETIKYKNTYYRKYTDYRQERLSADTVYAEKLREISDSIYSLTAKKNRLNTQILNIYASD